MKTTTGLRVGPSAWENMSDRMQLKLRVVRLRVRQFFSNPRYLGRVALFLGIWAFVASSAVYSLWGDAVKTQEKLAHVQERVREFEARNVQLTARLSESRDNNKRLARMLAGKSEMPNKNKK